jgi:hypothetical protein
MASVFPDSTTKVEINFTAISSFIAISFKPGCTNCEEILEHFWEIGVPA